MGGTAALLILAAAMGTEPDRPQRAVGVQATATATVVIVRAGTTASQRDPLAPHGKVKRRPGRGTTIEYE